jgi:hypothetical protein
MNYWVVVRFSDGATYGPVAARDPSAAVSLVASGTGRYVAQGRGRYCAVRLAEWQAGVYDWTKTRGAEKVDGGRGEAEVASWERLIARIRPPEPFSAPETPTGGPDAGSSAGQPTTLRSPENAPGGRSTT